MDESYALAVAAIERAGRRTPGLIRHASLHGLSGARRDDPDPVDPPGRLRGAMLDLVSRGWELHRLVTLHSEQDLDREVNAAGRLAEMGRVLVRATAGGVGGHVATITLDDRLTVLGLDDPHSSFVRRALLLEDPAATRFWVEHFTQVFDDRRHTCVILSPAGLHQDGIAELRRRLRALARIGGVPEPVSLTQRQRDVIERLGRTPRPQLKEIAHELNLSYDYVKDVCEQLYERFGIPKGRDRLGALVEVLRARGII